MGYPVTFSWPQAITRDTSMTFGWLPVKSLCSSTLNKLLVAFKFPALSTIHVHQLFPVSMFPVWRRRTVNTSNMWPSSLSRSCVQLRNVNNRECAVRKRTKRRHPQGLIGRFVCEKCSVGIQYSSSNPWMRMKLIFFSPVLARAALFSVLMNLKLDCHFLHSSLIGLFWLCKVDVEM